jgi:phthiocerol/phenolphthiocerol synthesis type-I polyketide synthase E
VSDLFEPIAIVGIAGRLPGAADMSEYWANLAAGRDCLTALTDSELLRAGVPASRFTDPAYVKMAGLVPGADQFDPAFFRMTQREAEVCDPQLRLFLEVTYEAIQNAGYDPVTMSRDVAIYGASGPSRYGDVHVLANPKYAAAPDMGLTVLNNIDYLTTLVSYKLDFRGPSMAVLTACSSSLTAVHLACQSLQLGDCGLAVAGGSNVEIPYGIGYRWSPGDVRSADGHCRPFDASASGTIFTSGAGAVLLKRLDDAITDGDHIWAVIHGIGVNNDGSDKVSFSAPSVTGQSLAIADAMAMAGFAPGDIGCVEMHATGTPLGDPIELSALTQAYRRLADGPLAAGSIPVGSVKSNIGHTVPVAGVAGLLKLVLALENEQIPPTINVTQANPKLGIEDTPFQLNRKLRPWPRQPGRPRRAGLSSLGIGGTNVHLVLAEGPAPAPTPHLDRPRVVIWSGRDEAATRASQVRLAEYFATAGETGFADATATLQRGRTAHPVRSAAICTSAQQAAGLLAGPAPASISGLADTEPAGVVFAFPGQGSQHARMAAGLYGSQRVFTETIDVCFDILGGPGADFYPLWLAEEPGQDLHQTANTQPLLFAVEYALARQWMAWGITPDAVLGHSLGELVAATVAGVMDLDDALRLVRLRGRVMQDQPGGTMLAAAVPADQLRTLLPAGTTGVAVAAVNSPNQTVLAGPAGDLAAAARALAAAGIATRSLPTSHAFHTPAMYPAAEAFLAGFAGISLRPPALPVYSGGTGRLLTSEQATSPAFWAGQLTDPVLFSAVLEAVTEVGAGRFLLEVGPGRALTRLAARHPAIQSAGWRALPSLSWPTDRDRSRSDAHDLLEALAGLWVQGVPVDWSSVYPDEPLQRVPLPGYPWQRSRYWVEAVTGPAAPQSPGHTPAPVAPVAPAAPVAGPFAVTTWTETERPTPPAPAGPAPAGVVLALLPAGPAAISRTSATSSWSGRPAWPRTWTG